MNSAPLPTTGGGSTGNTLLHTKLSAFYFLYYGVVGAWLPYWPLYLHDLGYAPAQIGTILAATAITRVVAPVLWGWIMDRTGRRMAWIAGGMFASSIVFSGIPWTPGFTAILLLHVTYAVFWNVALPAFDVVTLNHVARTGEDYSRIRLWGSVGFIVAVAGLGPILDYTGISPLPWIIFGGMMAMAILGLALADAHDGREEDPALGGIFKRMKAPATLALLGACFLSQLSFAPFYSFFSIFLEQHDYARTVIGGLWALGVLAEVVIFLYAGRIIARFGARPVLISTLLCTAFRWVLLAVFVEWPSIVAFSQVLHFLSFGVYHAVTVHYIHQIFPGRLQGRGQAVLAATSFGLGGAVGSFLAGKAWADLGGEMIYLIAAAAALLGAGFARLAPVLRSGQAAPTQTPSTLEA